MQRSPKGALVASSSESVGLELQSLDRRLGLAQPRQELVQRAIEIVQRVHCRVQQFTAIDDAGNERDK